MNYQEYLSSKKWQALRKQVLKRDNYSCQLCTSKDDLQIHHKTYVRFGFENLDDLITLCKKCHEKHHDEKIKQREIEMYNRLYQIAEENQKKNEGKTPHFYWEEKYKGYWD